MIKTFEILNDGAFVVTKINGTLEVGYYHNVFNNDSEERIFEPLAPLSAFNAEELFKLAEDAD